MEKEVNKTAEEILRLTYEKHMGNVIPTNPAQIVIECMQSYATQQTATLTTKISELERENERLREALEKIQYAGFVGMRNIARYALTPKP